jgi:hypothetical protein
MTTEQHMLATIRTTGRASYAFFLLLPLLLLPAGCSSNRYELQAPTALIAPYETAQGDVLWAVAPPRNESGVGVLDPLDVADTLAATLQEVRGVTVVPVNRTLGAMRSIGIEHVSSPADARRLALELGVDGVIVSSITAWNPYKPPRIGLNLALYGRPGSDRLTERAADVDPRELTSATTERRLPNAGAHDQALSVAAAHLDAANHEVLMSVRHYAEGRHDPETALGWRGYLASMQLFTKFACYRLTGQLLDEERLRLARERVTAQALAR